MADSSPSPETAPDPAAPPSTSQPSSRDDAPSQDTPRQDPLRGSRTSGAFVGLILFGLVLLLLIVFIAQNTQDVRISFLAWDGTTPLAVALLIATAAAILLTATAGLLRIWQLRRRVRRAEHAPPRASRAS